MLGVKSYITLSIFTILEMQYHKIAFNLNKNPTPKSTGQAQMEFFIKHVYFLSERAIDLYRSFCR